MTSNGFLTREEALSGFGARRARTLLFLIESRTAHLVAQSRQAMNPFLTEQTAQERDLAFLEAFGLGREPPLRPTIQDLERHAPQWADLVPQPPRVRAALAQALGQKYAFIQRAVPHIRAVLGLDEPAVQDAYQRLYRQPLAAIYAPRVGLRDRVRWAWAALANWLESRPPFWTAFALTLTETVGGGMLALPIALAGLGPLAGVVLLVVLGLVNVLTAAYMAEAVARNGTIRYGSAFIGRAVTDYLGNAGALTLTVGIAVINFLGLWAFYIGFASTLADATGIRPELWVVLLFVIGLYFLRRESLSATVAAALVVGALNIGLILGLALLVLPHVQMTYLLYVNVPLLNGQPFDASILQLVFGTVLMAYFGHLSISNCAQVVTRRDPSGRSLIWGSMAAQAVAIVLYSIWVLVVNGAIAPQELAAQTGTVLVPLAATVGPTVRVLGTILVILAMGMASIHMSLSLFNLVRERLPAWSRPSLVLPRRRGRLVLRGRLRGRLSVRIELVYLGLEGNRPRFRLDVQWADQIRRLETAVPALGAWDAAALLDQIPELRGRGLRLTIEVEAATNDSARVRVASPLAMAYEGDRDAVGLGLADLLSRPDAERQLLTWITRQREVSLAQVVAHTGQDEHTARETLNGLLEQGVLREVETTGGPCYRARLAVKQGRQLPQELDQALGLAAPPTQAPPGVTQRVGAVLLSRRGRFLLSISPVFLTFLLIEWLLLANAASFTEPLNVLGVIVAPLMAGVFPVLLLLSSRQKGERVPAGVYRFLGHPVLTVSICLLYLAGLFAYGLVIWTDPVQRGLALGVGLLMIGLTVVVWRRGAFAPRLIVELREEQGAASATVVNAGQLAPATICLAYDTGSEERLQAATAEVPAFAELRRATFDMLPGRTRQLKVWAHRVTAENDSVTLAGQVDVRSGEEGQPVTRDLALAGGPIIMPLTGESCQVSIDLPQP
ncbi:MAG: hypothetical protein KJ734_10220 [Chloroflexi bacterium]|nr:hypothetical protein [Chloroflexota bacterium]